MNPQNFVFFATFELVNNMILRVSVLYIQTDPSILNRFPVSVNDEVARDMYYIYGPGTRLAAEQGII